MRSFRVHVAGSLVVVALLLMERAAFADVVGGGGDVPPVSHAPSGQRAVKRGVQAPAGMFHARALLHVNASKATFGKPTSLAPDLFYAISDSLQIGLLHNLPMGWQTLPGAGLCLTGTGTGRCPHVYDNVGLDLMYGLAFGDFHFSIHSSLYLLTIADPTWVMWTIGAAGKLHLTDVVAIFFNPQVGVALNHRDPTAANPISNEDMLFFPAELQFQAGERLSLKVLTGVSGHLADLGDTYRVPLGVGFIGNITTALDLGLRFSFDNLLGNQPMGISRTDVRSLSLLMHVRI